MSVFGRFHHRTTQRSGRRSSWERTSGPADASLPENGGRRHLSQVPYLLPKDVLETQRLDFQYYLIRSILHGNHASPLRSDVTSILDVGCGTGRWVIEMARTFPAAQVVGLDIELPRQSAPALPSTTSFVQAIPAAHWPRVVGELVRVTRPGGYVELLEGGDVFLNPGPATQRFLAWWREASRARGFDTSLMERLGRLLLDARLRDVQIRTLQVPVGKWAGTRERCWKRISWQASLRSSLCCVPTSLFPRKPLTRPWQNWPRRETATIPAINTTWPMDRGRAGAGWMAHPTPGAGKPGVRGGER